MKKEKKYSIVEEGHLEKVESVIETPQQPGSYGVERQKGKELQLKRTGPMETSHNSRITPGTHSLLGGQGFRVSEKSPIDFSHSPRDSNTRFLGF